MKNLRTLCLVATSGKNPAKILERSYLYHELSREKDEIEKLKWIESEKSGEDIGFEKALLMWAHLHRHDWRHARRSDRKNKINRNNFR